MVAREEGALFLEYSSLAEIAYLAPHNRFFIRLPGGLDKHILSSPSSRLPYTTIDGKKKERNVLKKSQRLEVHERYIM